MRPRIRTTASILAVTLFLGAAASTAAHGEDLRWFSAAIGTGQNVDVVRVGGAWQPDCTCESLAAIRATPLLLAHAEYWNARGDGASHDAAWNVGVLAGARWLLPVQSAWRPYIEFAFGGIAASNVRIGGRDLGSALLFDERLAAGVALDPAAKYQLATFVEHRSNGRITEPNDGLTTYGLELRVALP